MATWIDSGLQPVLFAGAEKDAAIWTGGIYTVSEGKDLVPLRFDGCDFWVVFVSPHAEMEHDLELLGMALNIADVHNFMPAEASRMIKFSRVEAEGDTTFKPELWKLRNRYQIFQFMEVLADVMLNYLASMPDVEQFFYISATPELEALYSRMLTRHLSDAVVGTKLIPGDCYVYKRA